MALQRSSFVSFLTLCLTSFVGCGSAGPKIVPVEGNVLLDGKPLEKVLVEFLPTSDGPRSFGETDSQGHFSLTTDDGKTRGASIGTHKVLLKDAAIFSKFMGRKGEGVDMSEGRKPRISGKLSNPSTTPLTVQVEAGKENKFELVANK